MEEKQALNKEIWSDLSKIWAVGIPPWRPSKMEVDIYRECLENIKHKTGNKIKALLLGATPELRDLLAKQDIETTIVDINPNMVRAMEELLEYSNGKEEVVIANWLSIPLEAEQFDLVLCDQGLHHIFFEQWDDFFREISRLLKKDGSFLLGIVTVNKAEGVTAEQVIDSYKKSIFTKEDSFYFNYRFWVNLKDIEGKKHYKFVEDINTALEEFVKKGQIKREELEFLKLPGPAANFKVVMPPKEVIDEVFSKHMLIKAVKSDFTHPVFSCHKIYFGKVKK